MDIQRTHDMDVIAAIVNHAEVLPFIHDDGLAGDPAQGGYVPQDHAEAYWMLIRNPEPVGAYLLHAHNAATYEIHTCLLPSLRGAGAAQAARLVIDWFFGEFKGLKLITHVPESNRAARLYAMRAGFRLEGINRKSFLKHGVLLDQHLLGLTQEDWLCQQQQ